MEKAKEIIEDVSSDMIGMYDVKEYEKELETLMKLHTRDETRAEIAKNMLNKNYSIKDIAEITGLTIEEIEKLQ